MNGLMQLQRLGVLNTTAPDLGEYTRAPRQRAAYCTSRTCAGNTQQSQTRRIKKEVGIAAVNCPDCGHALNWRKIKGFE